MISFKNLQVLPFMRLVRVPMFTFCSDPAFSAKSKLDPNADLQKTIDGWVKENKVVLFMKGVPQMPQCGFSNYAVQFLKYYKIENYKAINILEDDNLRQAVKEYSNWPTYPQLYINGELIGGCDILKEMHENNTFKDIVEREKI